MPRIIKYKPPNYHTNFKLLNMKKIISFIFSLSLLLLCSCSEDEAVLTANISGYVTDYVNANLPIAGATVTISTKGITKTTGSDGRYEFTDIEPGTYTLQVSANGYQTTTKQATLYAGENVNLDFQLSPAGQDVEITPQMLSFGPQTNRLTFSIKNKGNSSMQYSITNYPNYITVSPSTGSISAKGTQTVSVNVNRDLLTTDATCQLLVNIGNDSYPVNISINSEEVSQKISVTPSVLDFGTDYKELQFTIKNVGTAGDLSWNISQPSEACIQVSPTVGTTAVGKSTQVTVKLDRNKMQDDLQSFININVAGGSVSVQVIGTLKSEEGGNSSGSDETAVTQGMYVYYKFDNNFDDSSENAIHGFGYNNPTFVQGVTSDSKAIKFSRTNKSSFVVPQPIIDSREMSISFWGKDFNDGGIFYMTSSHNDNMFTLSMNGGDLKFIVTRYNNNYNYNSTGSFMHPSLSDGQWHHIVLTSDFNKTTYSVITTTLYVDGQAVDVITENANYFTEGETSNNSYGSGVKFILGGEIELYSSVLNATNMSIDNFRVYDTRLLTPEEVKMIYDTERQ